MGIIQKQGIKSSLYIMIGFVIGAINLLILFPLFFSKNDQGLVRAMIDIGATFSVVCTLGTLPVVYKFFPFYNHYVGPQKNELPFITLVINLIGFGLLLLIGYNQQDFIIRKLGKSPSLAQYFNYIYPYTFFLLIFYWLESFAWGIQKGVYTNFLRETAVRFLTTLLIIAFGCKLISFENFIILFSCIYVVPVILLFISLHQSKQWYFRNFKFSNVTRRLKGKMINFALFVFAGSFLNLLARTNDTFMIIGFRGLSDAGIFAIATYVSAILEIPQRSLNSISIPILATSWKNKNIANIKHIYNKSISNLLVIGLLLFGLIWLNSANLVSFLNWISHKESGGYDAISKLIFILGLAQLIELGTGVSGQIIGTSNYWRFDFFTNLLYILISLPLNYYLIRHYNLEGLAYSNLIAKTLYNLVRYIFIYKKFGLQPYHYKHGLFLLASVGLMVLVHQIPLGTHLFLNIALLSSVYLIGLSGLILIINPAPDIQLMVSTFFKQKLVPFFIKLNHRK